MAVTHHNLNHLAASSPPGLPAAQVWTQCHSYAFDFSVWEIWAALLGGGRLVVVPDSVVRSPDDFHALLVREQVNVLTQTPSLQAHSARRGWSRWRCCSAVKRARRSWWTGGRPAGW